MGTVPTVKDNLAIGCIQNLRKLKELIIYYQRTGEMDPTNMQPSIIGTNPF